MYRGGALIFYISWKVTSGWDDHAATLFRSGVLERIVKTAA